MKDVFVLLCMGGMIAAFVLFMRQQDILKEQRSADIKRLEESIKSVKGREVPRGGSSDQVKLRELEVRRLELEERKRNSEDARRAAHLESVAAVQKELVALRAQLAALRDNRTPLESDETRKVAEEIAKIDKLLNDKIYECYDDCIKFNEVKFKRIMKHPTDRPDNRGYYQVVTATRPYYKDRRGAKIYLDPNVIKDARHVFWEAVPVCYVCEKHNLTWTEQAANYYQHNVYAERTTLETNKSLLKRKLAQLHKELAKQRPQLIADVEAQISAKEAELAQLIQSGGSITPANVAAAQPAADAGAPAGRK